MIRICKNIQCQKIRLCVIHNLIFFALVLISACDAKKEEHIKILWRKNQATGVLVPQSLAGSISIDSLSRVLFIRLSGDSTNTDILGEYKLTAAGILFEPLVPFTRGSTYEVFSREKRISLIQIPLANLLRSPVLSAVYPTQDTVPENLLKIYLQFSKPMREGESKQYISLIENERDTLKDVFLDLQPELWNEDRTVLTIWLDPGRIKRDLQPNRRLGNPLKKGQHYKLVISGQWKDIEGLKLKHPFSKKIVVSSRDSISPDPREWVMVRPKNGSVNALQLNVGRALDYFLLKESIRVFDAQGNLVQGKIEIVNQEKILRFIPNVPWSSGVHILRVETRLEDLAGNNVNRPFDRDLKNSKAPGSKTFFDRDFLIN